MHLRADLQSAVSALGHPPLRLDLASLTSHLLASIPAAPSLYHTLLSLLYLLNPTHPSELRSGLPWWFSG